MKMVSSEWNEKRYLSYKEHYRKELEGGKVKPYTLMEIYKKSIELDDFEEAKAITELIAPFHYETVDTHRHINCLKKKHEVIN